MFFRVFSLHPDIFSSFLKNGLLARSVEKGVNQFEFVNWREEFGVGGHKQVDDRPFGGGTGMVLQVEPIFQALKKHQAISNLFQIPDESVVHKKLLPNNSKFFKKIQNGSFDKKKVTISLTPRGFSFNQKIAEWLVDFEEINLVCGRYEGFDSRCDELVDLELSVGDYILNGGEVGAMALVESVSRLVPGFLVKENSAKHDSFSSNLNEYKEQEEFVVGARKMVLQKNFEPDKPDLNKNLFDDEKWLKEKLPFLEHPQYTRPEVWKNWRVPKVLLEGNHMKIQEWRRDFMNFS